MKQYLCLGLVLACALFSLTACEDYQGKLQEEKQAQQLLQQQIKVLEEEEKLINGEYADALETMTAVNETLNEIAANNRKMEKLVQERAANEGTSLEQSILLKIQAIQDANAEAAQEAKALRSKMRAYKVENKQLQKVIEQLEAKFTTIESDVYKAETTIVNMQLALNELETEVAATDTKLASAYAELKVNTDKLERTNNELEVTLEELKNKTMFIEEDAKAFIACGTKKVLRRNKIIRLLSAKTLTLEYQTEVRKVGSEFDYFNNTEIDCGEGEIQYILPNRPTETYEVTGGKVTIKDTKAFWATSKTVVLVKR